MPNLVQLALEVASLIICMILVRFMAKPYLVTGQSRYLGLPLGFAFLGVSYALTALSISQVVHFQNIWWIQLFFRAFAFLFLLVTYLLLKESRNLTWNALLGVFVIIFAILIMLTLISPQFLGSNYFNAQLYARIFMLFCLFYISVHTLKSHLDKPDPATLMIPLGFVLLSIAQYLQIIWVVDRSLLSFWSGIAVRLCGLLVFLFVSYRTFYNSKIRGANEDNPSQR
jgi:hypothetical protein